MFLEDMTIGMRVIPISRTILVRGEPEVRNLHTSIAYQLMMQHLIISKFDYETGRVMCHPENFPEKGDWFMEYDLKEFESEDRVPINQDIITM